MNRYVGLIDGESGAYGIVIPDARGYHAMGDTIDEAFDNAAEVLAEWASDIATEGREVPPPRSLEEVLHDPAVVAEMREVGSTPVLIPLVIDSGRAVKANISLDAGLLAAIDAAAKRNGLTRSAFLATAAREKIASGR